MDAPAGATGIGVWPAVRRVAAAHPLPVATVPVYWTVFTVIGIVNGRSVWPFYLLLLVLLTTLACVFEDRVGLGRPLLWLLALWGSMHMAGGILEFGDGPSFYFAEVIPGVLRYDQVVHGYGGAMTALVAGRVLTSWLPRFGFGAALLVTLAGLGAAALGEITEFLSTKVLADVNIGDHDNNGWDLVFDLLGAIVAAAISYRWARRSQPKPTGPRG